MKNLFILATLSILASCSSSNYKVIEKMNDSSKPGWADLSKTTWKEDGKLWAIGFAEGDQGSNLSALARISDNNAKTELTRMISNDIGAVLQNTSEGVNSQSDQSRWIGTEKSQVWSNQVTPEKRYYEKKLYSNGTDTPTMKVEYYSLVSIPEGTYRELLAEYKRKREPANTSELTTAANAQFSQMVGTQPVEKQEPVQPQP